MTPEQQQYEDMMRRVEENDNLLGIAEEHIYEEIQSVVEKSIFPLKEHV